MLCIVSIFLLGIYFIYIVWILINNDIETHTHTHMDWQ